MNDQPPPTPAWVITGGPPRLPPMVTGKPAVLNDLAIAPGLSITVMLQILRNSGLIMRLPPAPGGGDGVVLNEAVRDAMLQAALDSVMLVPWAVAHMQTPHPNTRPKVGGRKQRGERNV